MPHYPDRRLHAVIVSTCGNNGRSKVESHDGRHMSDKDHDIVLNMRCQAFFREASACNCQEHLVPVPWHTLC